MSHRDSTPCADHVAKADFVEGMGGDHCQLPFIPVLPL
jgi:hypothetical protein